MSDNKTMSDKITYLIVEDQHDQAEILRAWLMRASQPLEIVVLVEDNLETGIKVSNDYRPDTTFCDLHIPLVPGGPICEDWRQVADGSVLMVPPVIGITGYDISPEMRVYCITDRKMEDLFQKPFNEGFFQRLGQKHKIFAADLIKASSAAVLRAAGRDNEP